MYVCIWIDQDSSIMNEPNNASYHISSGFRAPIFLIYRTRFTLLVPVSHSLSQRTPTNHHRSCQSLNQEDHKSSSIPIFNLPSPPCSFLFHPKTKQPNQVLQLQTKPAVSQRNQHKAGSIAFTNKSSSNLRRDIRKWRHVIRNRRPQERINITQHLVFRILTQTPSK